ncbi:MAG: SPOR domain-containing protein [Treponema sp.]|jgi:tetratricopeptide (TPR) repeat protein|nr:SPOR domain-containing protein [Treponema sp.]
MMKIPMGSINSRTSGGCRVLAALILSCLGLPLYAQETGASLLTAEIETLRKTLQSPEVSASGRREALTRLARFLTLSGNLEEAADAWFKAAAAEPDKRDDMSLLKGVRCLIAMGQFDAAEEYVKTVLLTGEIWEVQVEARYLGAQIQAFKTGNGAVLDAFLKNPEYADRRPSTLYTLWRITGEEAYRVRLETDYPSSPEGRICRDVPAGQVQRASTAMWIFLSGREGIVLSEPSPAAGSLQPAAGRAPGPPPDAASPAVSSGSLILQTGLFSREENTSAMAEQLKKAGFTPLITRRRVNGTEYWAVGVPPGENMNDTIRALKNAGFESFPVY